MNRQRTYILLIAIVSTIGTAALLWFGSRESVIALVGMIDKNPALVALAFSGWALVANCLILPAGSLSLIAGGAVLGTFLPAVIWYLAQLGTAPLLYRLAAQSSDRGQRLVRRYLGPTVEKLFVRGVEDGIAATAVLRLTPFIPSAPATMIAAASGIPLRSFLTGSALVGWVRPLYFASIGTAAGSLARAGELSIAAGTSLATPLIILFGATLALFVARLYLTQRRA